jgi:hypothetical protein
VGVWIQLVVRYELRPGRAAVLGAAHLVSRDLNVSYHVGVYGFSVWLDSG